VFPHNAEKTPHGQSDLQILPQALGMSSSRASDGDEMEWNSTCRAEEMNDEVPDKKEGTRPCINAASYSRFARARCLHVWHVNSKHSIKRLYHNTI
jgi:hypothetical protein